jgi:NitT/TauT family transport system ATP-binding protein
MRRAAGFSVRANPDVSAGARRHDRHGAAIAIRDLCKTYESARGHVTALDAITLDVRPGEFFCIVGPSGCGKSTLLRILAGLERQSSGSFEIARDGAAVENAMVFQESGLFPWMSLERNVEFGLMTRGVSRAERQERAAAALKLVGLSRFRRHFPHQLSGGMRQRAAIARAFVTDPALLLMDEPFAALDAQNRVILQDELVRIWETTGKTVVYITHSLDEALFLGDRMAILTAQPGRLKQIVDIPFAHPRRFLELTSSAAFGEMKRAIWHALEEEVMRARSEAEGE